MKFIEFLRSLGMFFLIISPILLLLSLADPNLGLYWVRGKRTRKLSIYIYSRFFAFALALLAISFLFGCGSVSEYSEDNVKTTAWVISNELVKSKLPSPSTAEFPAMYESDITYYKDSTVLIVSHVEAQNAFGAKVKTGYLCELKYKGGNVDDAANWHVKRCFLRE